MLKLQTLYSAENVDRAKYVQIAVSLLAVSFSGYIGLSTFRDMRGVWRAQSMLTNEKMQAGQLSRQTQALKGEQLKLPPNSNGGVDALALQLSQWAGQTGVKIDAVTPQGDPQSSDITLGRVSLGTWNAAKVRVEGHGDFQQVLGLLERLRNPGMPVRLESFVMNSGAAGANEEVGFDLMLTVYERKRGTG